MQTVQLVADNASAQSTESSRSTPIPPELADQSSTLVEPSHAGEPQASASSSRSTTGSGLDKSRDQLLKLVASLTEEKARAHESFVADKKAAKVPYTMDMKNI